MAVKVRKPRVTRKTKRGDNVAKKQEKKYIEVTNGDKKLKIREEAQSVYKSQGYHPVKESKK